MISSNTNFPPLSLVLTYPEGEPLSYGIALGQFEVTDGSANYSHIAVVDEDGEHILEMTFPRCTRSPISKYLTAKHRTKIANWTTLTDTERIRGLDWARSQLGKRYPWENLIYHFVDNTLLTNFAHGTSLITRKLGIGTLLHREREIILLRRLFLSHVCSQYGCLAFDRALNMELLWGRECVKSKYATPDHCDEDIIYKHGKWEVLYDSERRGIQGNAETT